MAGSFASSAGVVYVDASVTLDPTDCGVVFDGLNTRPGRLQLATLDPDVLYRLAACAMTAAHELTGKLAVNAASTANGAAVSVSR